MESAPGRGLKRGPGARLWWWILSIELSINPGPMGVAGASTAQLEQTKSQVVLP